MAEDEESGRDVIKAENSKGFVNRPSGPVYQYFADTINQGASVAEIIEALREAEILPRLATRLPEKAFIELLEIVGRVELPDAGERMSRACSDALPPTAHLVNSKNPSVLLANMCEQQQLKAWPPLFECIERFVLTEGLPAAVVGDLRNWVTSTIALVRPPVLASELERLRSEIAAEATPTESDGCSWLQVYLEPDLLNRTHERKQPLFRVELVLWSSKTKGALVIPTGPEADSPSESTRLWTLDDLPALLDRVFAARETVALIPSITLLVIEIVAPSDLLMHGFERWKRKEGVETYGTQYPVVVRLRDRLAIPDPSDQKRADEYWKLKWHAFRSALGEKKCDVINWRTPGDLDVFELQDDNDLACLGLSAPLSPERREVFDALRDAGIPVALWIRGSDLGPGLAADPDLRHTISKLLEGNRLCELREAIQRVRRSKEARQDATYVGNALTLLWDDPDRPPLKYESQGVFK